MSLRGKLPEERLALEKSLYEKGIKRVIGMDEVGRGPLAGPVVACAVYIPEGLYFEKVNDSKKLSPKVREKLYEALTGHPEVFYGIGIVDSEEIDRINIFQATLQAMRQAYHALKDLPEYVLVDGVDLSLPVPSRKIIRGDSLSYMIGAASVLAKVTRDRLMLDCHRKWPEYGFDRHKGYGTEGHLQALRKHGFCPIHRKSFEPVKTMYLKGNL